MKKQKSVGMQMVFQILDNIELQNLSYKKKNIIYLILFVVRNNRKLEKLEY